MKQPDWWYKLLKENYESVALSLVVEGYERQKTSDLYKEHFVRGNKKLAIVRQLGCPEWYTEEVQ